MQFESYFFNKAESSGEYCYATAFLLVLLLLYLFRGLLNPILSFCKEQCKYLWFAMLSEESFSFSIYLSLAEHHYLPPQSLVCHSAFHHCLAVLSLLAAAVCEFTAQ